MLCSLDLNPPEELTDEVVNSLWLMLEEVERTALEEGGVNVKVVLLSQSPRNRARLEEIRAFAEERVRGVWNSRKELDEILGRYLQNWSLYRLGTVERNALRIGAWEIMHHSDIPTPIVVNEAVDITKFFSVRVSGKFVNGVLDRLAKVRNKELDEGVFVPGEIQSALGEGGNDA